MKFLKENKYFDLFILVVIAIIVYKLIDNYQYFFVFINKLYSIISPFVIAAVCAYILNPMVNMFEKKFNLSRALSITCTYTFLGGVTFVILFFTIPSLINAVITITDEVPAYLSRIQEYSSGIFVNNSIDSIIPRDEIYKKLDVILTQAGNHSVVILQNSLSSILSLTGNIVKYLFGFLISIYVLMDKEKILNQSKIIIYMLFKEKNGNIILSVVNTYHTMIGRYIGIKSIDSMIIGIIAFICLYILRTPYSVLIACVVAVTNMIPYFGPLVGEVFGAFITIFVSPIKALAVFIILLLIQQFDAWYLDPKLIGKKVGVSPFGIIFAVIIGGGIFGPVGMLLASPTMATINIYYSRMISNYKNKHPKLFK